MKKLLITILILLISVSVFADMLDEPAIKKNGVYIEGYLIRHDFSDGFASINYERSIGKKGRTNLRIGLYPDYESTMSFPFTISWVTHPKSKHHFEYGIGGVFRVEHYVSEYNTSGREWFYDFAALMIPLMYRYHGRSPWYFRAGINLFISWPILPSPSISVGYRF